MAWGKGRRGFLWSTARQCGRMGDEERGGQGDRLHSGHRSIDNCAALRRGPGGKRWGTVHGVRATRPARFYKRIAWAGAVPLPTRSHTSTLLH